MVLTKKRLGNVPSNSRFGKKENLDTVDYNTVEWSTVPVFKKWIICDFWEWETICRRFRIARTIPKLEGDEDAACYYAMQRKLGTEVVHGKFHTLEDAVAKLQEKCPLEMENIEQMLSHAKKKDLMEIPRRVSKKPIPYNVPIPPATITTALTKTIMGVTPLRMIHWMNENVWEIEDQLTCFKKMGMAMDAKTHKALHKEAVAGKDILKPVELSKDQIKELYSTLE